MLVDTVGDQTPNEMKGRLLGVMEPSREPVRSMDFNVRKRPGDFVDGEYKWPVGLINLRAWSLPQRPKLNAITDRKFSMDSAQGIVPLNEEGTVRIRALDWLEEELLQPTAQAVARLALNHGTSKRSAPPPTTKRTGIMHMRRAPTYTYAMKIVGAQPSAFKIGWAFDFKQRAKPFNHAAMPQLGGLEYKPFLFHLWDTAHQAFALEQALLYKFSDKQRPENREVVVGISENEMNSVWLEGVSGRLAAG